MARSMSQEQGSANPEVAEIISKIPNAKIYENNPRLLQRLYGRMTPPKTSLKDATEGDRIDGIEVLVVDLLYKRDVSLCSECNASLKGDEGQMVPCNSAKCGGQDRRVVVKKSYKFEAGTPDTSVVLDFAPFNDLIKNPDDLIPKVVKITGKVEDYKRRDGVKSIAVSKIEVVRDLRENSETPPPKEEPITLKVQTNIPLEKVAQLKSWLSILAKSNPKGVSEAQIKTYVEKVMGAKWEDALPLLKSSEGLYVFNDAD